MASQSSSTEFCPPSDSIDIQNSGRPNAEPDGWQSVGVEVPAPIRIRSEASAIPLMDPPEINDSEERVDAAPAGPENFVLNLNMEDTRAPAHRRYDPEEARLIAQKRGRVCKSCKRKKRRVGQLLF